MAKIFQTTFSNALFWGKTFALCFTFCICNHYSGVIMGSMASQISGVSSVCPTVCSRADQRKYQSSASLAFVRGIHRWPVDSSHKGPVTRKIFPFDDVFMPIWPSAKLVQTTAWPRTGGMRHVLSRPAHFSWIFYINPSSSRHVHLRDAKMPALSRILGTELKTKLDMHFQGFIGYLWCPKCFILFLSHGLQCIVSPACIVHSALYNIMHSRRAVVCDHPRRF